MAKLKVEAEQAKWQMMFTLAGQGYNSLINEFAEQLNAQMDAPTAQAPANANGEDKAAAQPQGN